MPQSRTGEIVRIDVQSGAKTVIATVRPGIDNLAFAADDRLFISHFVDGGVAEVATDGSSAERVLVPAGFVGPWGLVYDEAGTLYVADGLSLAAVSAAGEVTRLGGALDARFPGFVRAIAAGAPGELLLTTARGDVVRYCIAERSFTTPGQKLHQLYGLAAAEDGTIVVAEASRGVLLRVDDAGQVSTLATDLSQPCDVVAAGDGTFLVSETGAGRVITVDAEGHVAPICSGFTKPKGLALYHDGSILVLDHGTNELCAVDLHTQQQHVLASHLPVGATGAMDFPGGLAVSRDGTIYIAGDGDGSILTLRRV